MRASFDRVAMERGEEDFFFWLQFFFSLNETKVGFLFTKLHQLSASLLVCGIAFLNLLPPSWRVFREIKIENGKKYVCIVV